MNILSLLNNDPNSSKYIKFNQKFVHINRKCNLKHWNSYLDSKNNVQIMILGRPVIDVFEWTKFDSVEESYISKILIKKYIELEIHDFCNQLNGAFSILIIDYNSNKIIIVNDKLGIYPIYVFGINNLQSFQFSSNFDTLKDNVKKNINIDKVSIAEFLKKGFIYHPNTFYKEIKTLDSGSYSILDFEKKEVTFKKYFKFNLKPTNDFNYLVNKLSKALLNSIERRSLEVFGKKAVFLSGGTDSRMILANSSDPNIDAITLYSEENHEIKVTKNIAKLLNVNHKLIKRDKDYYFNSFDSSIKINGGRSLPTDDHFLNLRYDKSIEEYDTILTGCYADWIFKGIALDRKQISFLSFKLPLYKLKNFHYDFFSKRTLLKDKYEKMIREREDQIFLDKKSHINNEINRIFPLFQEETSATRSTLQQLFPWDSILSDNDVIDAYNQIPAKFKINSEVYDRAVSKILKKVKNIPHANKRHKIGINKYFGTIFYIVSILKNKILKLIRIKKINPIAGEGSWISFKEYAKSKKISVMWEKIQDLELYREMLSVKKFTFNEIIKSDYKLIYKCIALNKILHKHSDRLDD